MRFPELFMLETERLYLRRITGEDIPGYNRLFGSAEVARWMLWEPHTSLEQSAAAVEKVLARYDSGRCYRWGITRKDEDILIGILELLRFDEARGECSFAYMLAPDCWNRGYGTEALKAAFRFAFEEMGVRTITADHFADNPASGAVMRKAGMAYVRMLPGRYEKNGRCHDAAEYRITKEIWEKQTRC